MLKKVVISLVVFFALLIGAYNWLINSIAGDQRADPDVLPSEIAYIADHSKQNRGTILAVVTSTDVMGRSGKSTGYELSELARAYYVFQANGFNVEIASIQGGEPPVVIDQDDMSDFDYAFLNDTVAQHKVVNTRPIDSVVATDYRAVFFVGGKGAMFDFPDNQAAQALIREMYENGKVIAAVCHGPAALVNVTLSNGEALLAGKHVSSFTNSEELTLISDAEDIFPFLLESKLTEKDALFAAGPDYLNQVVVDGTLVTGQNPWSVWELAELTVAALGYSPIPRTVTAEENSAAILKTYYLHGLDKARIHTAELLAENRPLKRELIAIHAILGILKLEPGDTIAILRLLSASNKVNAA